MNAITLYVPLLCFTLFLYTGCCFERPECKDYYRIYLPLNIEPLQQSYQLNDTIRITADFSQEILDSNSLQYIDFNFPGTWNVMYLISIDSIGQPDAFPDFELLADSLEVKVVSHATNNRYVSFLNSGGRYTIDFQLIPKQPGIYLMGFNIGFHHSFIIKCCGEEVINEYLNVHNGAHNNYSLLMLSPDTSIQQIPFKVFRESGNFAFQVME
jgi:hypothetical protein